jgi:hypothetical protein
MLTNYRKVFLLWTIVILSLIVIGGGGAYLAKQQNPSSIEYINAFGFRFLYPSDWIISSPIPMTPTRDTIWLASPTMHERISITAWIIPLDQAEERKQQFLKIEDITKVTIGDFEGIKIQKDTITGQESFVFAYELYKKINAESYLLISAFTSTLFENNSPKNFESESTVGDIEIAERVFAEIIPTMTISNKNMETGVASATTTNPEDWDQSSFDIISEGTPLQGHVLIPADQYTFTDGGGGVDTVGYKYNRSHYTVYKGNDVPVKGYYNPIIVVGEDPHFIEVDVNSELVQFKDQILSIPDLVLQPR